MTTIAQIDNILYSDNAVIIQAVIEDSVLTYAESRQDPAEYGPALCETTISTDTYDDLPLESEDQLIEYIQNLSLDWKVVDQSDIYDFTDNSDAYL
jgi:hypothetical protein